MTTKLILAIATVVLTSCAVAQEDRIVGVVDTTNFYLSLHSSQRKCAGDSLYAEILLSNNKTISGCWILEGPNVVILWDDGDFDRFPMRAVRPPKTV